MHQYEEQELLIKKGVTLINGRDLDTCSSKDLVRAIKDIDGELKELKELKELNVVYTAITKTIEQKEQLLKDLVEILDAKEEETE